MKYIAIKVRGLNYWLWFEADKTKLEDGEFFGEYGWGKDGAKTSISVSSFEITGKIYSDELQYR